MPNKTVILAAYDNAHDAHMAIRELYNGGFQKNDIHYTSDENDDLESILNEDRPDPTHEGLGAIFSNVMSAIGDFFSGTSNLAEEDKVRFNNHMRNGYIVVSLKSPPEGVSRAQQILLQRNPVDMLPLAEEMRVAGGIDMDATW